MSLQKVAPKHNIFIQTIRNGMLYCLSFTTETPIRRFQNVLVSIWGQIYINTYKNQTPSLYHGVLGGQYRCWHCESIHLSTWPKNLHEGQHQLPGWRVWPLEDSMQSHTSTRMNTRVLRLQPSLLLCVWPGWVTRTKIQCNNKDELKARITAAFINLNDKTNGYVYRIFRNRREDIAERNSDLFL